MTARMIVGLSLLLPALAWADPAADAARLDELYQQRDSAQAQAESDQLATMASATGNADYGTLWRAARWRWWVADGVPGDQKKRLGKQAWQLGERAIKANPKGMEGLYFTSVGIGAYSQAVGVLTALTEGLEGAFNTPLDAAIAANPTFMGCAPLIAKGRYYYELPWPKRNLGKSAEQLAQAIAKCPTSTRAYVFLAQTQLKDGEPKKAKATLAQMPREEGPDPAETHRCLGLAKNLQSEIDAELK